MAKVSIIIPVYNAEKTIRKCLDAILNQSFEDFEAICVNDGSSDNSLKILQEYANKDDRIKVYSQKNSGPAFTRNFAISKSSGEYLMFCDIDDWYEKQMIQKMVTTIENHAVDIVMCNCNITDLVSNNVQTEHANNYFFIKLIGKVNIDTKVLPNINVVLWNKIFKRSILEKYNVVYPDNYEHDDLIFMLKYLANAKTYYGIDEKLYNYVIGNPNSIMGKLYNSTNNGKEYDFIYAYKNLFEYLRSNKNIEYKLYIKNLFIDVFFHFIKYLPKEKVDIAFNNLKNLVNSSKFFENNNPYTIECLCKSSSFADYLKKINSSRVTFLQQIFSIKNEYNLKVVRILGIKISFSRKKYFNR